MTKFRSILLICFLGSSICFAQEDELEMMDTVAKLQSQLKSESNSVRDKAEQQLIDLGPAILEFLEAGDRQSTTDFRERVARIRKKLEKVAVEKTTQASQVKLNGKMTVGDALKKIQRQTRNIVKTADPSFLDIPIEVDIDASFWQAMSKVMSQAALQIDPYGSPEPGQLLLTKTLPGNAQPEVPTSTDKIFHTQVIRVNSSANIQQPKLDYTSVTLQVRWEPRLRPISVDIPMSSVSIVDEFDDAIMLSNQREVVYGMVQPEIPQVEFLLQLPRIERQVESLKSLKATLNALLPGKIEQFSFKNLSKLKPGFNIEKAGAKVTFGGMSKNEDAFAIKMSISFDESNNALESHQGWVFQNEVYLIDAQGNREDALSLETLRHDNEKVTVQYYFVEEPGNRTLIYKTPASIVKLPVKIELNKIALP